jgi:hypothetical protein
MTALMCDLPSKVDLSITGRSPSELSLRTDHQAVFECRTDRDFNAVQGHAQLLRHLRQANPCVDFSAPIYTLHETARGSTHLSFARGDASDHA